MSVKSVGQSYFVRESLCKSNIKFDKKMPRGLVRILNVIHLQLLILKKHEKKDTKSIIGKLLLNNSTVLNKWNKKCLSEQFNNACFGNEKEWTEDTLSDAIVELNRLRANSIKAKRKKLALKL